MAKSPLQPRNLFSLRIKKFVNQVKADRDTVIKKIALDCFSKIIMRSPVDTGRFRGNWQVSIGEMPAGTILIESENKKIASAEDDEATEEKERSVYDKDGTITVGKAQAEILGLKAGDVIFLVNNLPYAWQLENGHSRQSPNGMVELTVIEYQQMLDDAVAETKRKVS